MFRSSHFGQSHFKAWHFGGLRGIIAATLNVLAGAIKRVAPVIAFKRVRQVTRFEYDD